MIYTDHKPLTFALKSKSDKHFICSIFSLFSRRLFLGGGPRDRYHDELCIAFFSDFSCTYCILPSMLMINVELTVTIYLNIIYDVLGKLFE